jgi:hypothetical protein
MAESQDSDLTCERCGQSVAQDAVFCRSCGALFSDQPRCSVHHSVEAAGVCVICSKPFCKDCGGDVKKIFLCDSHFAEYEIYEGMARVFGCTDNVQAQFVTTCLEQAGFHPFLYSRMFNPGADLVALTGPRNFGRYPIVELKVLLPFSEVLNAKKTLSELDLNK